MSIEQRRLTSHLSPLNPQLSQASSQSAGWPGCQEGVLGETRSKKEDNQARNSNIEIRNNRREIRIRMNIKTKKKNAWFFRSLF
jgi:hypothetical protein